MSGKNVSISQVDVVFSGGSYPIEFLLYFDKGIDGKRVRAALRRAAGIFWPVFGRYRDGRICFEDYKEEDHLAEIKVPESFDVDFVAKNPLDTRRHYKLENSDGLFFLQIIHFNNGSVLIPKMSHMAGDGYSYFYFLSALAAFSGKGGLHPSALLYHSLFRPKHSRTLGKKFSFSGLDSSGSHSDLADLNIDVEHIPKEKIKNAVNEISASAGKRISSNDLLSAMVLRKIVDLKPEGFGAEVGLTFPVDVRRAVRKLGPRFFGNGILFHHMGWPKEDILRFRPEELAVEIRKAQPRMSGDLFRFFLEELEGFIRKNNSSALRPFDPETGCIVTNISRLPADKLNFGSGIPTLIAPLTVEKNSAGVLSDGEDFVLQIVY